jgi:hypothetical protein
MSKIPFKQRLPETFFQKHFKLIFTLTGALFFLAVAWIFISEYQFMKAAKTTTAEVVDFEIPKGKTLSQPIFDYYTPDSLKHTYHHPEGTNPPSYHIGAKATLYYDPHNPDDVMLGYSYIAMAILSFMGLIFLVIGFAAKRQTF